MKIKHTLAAALIASASLAAAGSAAAQDFAFRYKTYELQTQGGRADLMARLDRFVDSVCDPRGVRGLAFERAAEECKISVKAEIMAKIDNVEFASLD
jgi:UrcA family protein